MKFFSRYANYNVVLRSTIPADRYLGKPSIPGLFVRFENGMADVTKEEMIDLMLKHDKFKIDFVAEEDGSTKNWKDHEGSEPQHVIAEIKHGSVAKQIGKTAPFNPAMEGMLKEMATKMALEMAPKMALEMVKKLAEAQKSDKKEVVKDTKEVGEPPVSTGEAPNIKKSPGRPKRDMAKKTKKIEDETLEVEPTEEVLEGETEEESSEE